MPKSDGLKMARQLQIFDQIKNVRNGAICSPTELMSAFGISRRMLQRDLKDIRESGLINVKYNKSAILSHFIFDSSITIASLLASRAQIGK